MKEDNIKIGLLSTKDSYLLPFLLNELITRNINNIHVIFDSKLLGNKVLNVFKERTGSLVNVPIVCQSNYTSVNFHEVLDHNNDECIKVVEDLKLDMLVNSGTPRILKKKIIEAPKKGVLNCHPGILPKYRGCTCVEWAIYNDDEVGNTVHLITEGIDEGPVFRKEVVKISKQQSYYDYRCKVFYSGIKLVADVIADLTSGKALFEDAEFQEKGEYFSVIPDEKLKEVITKINKATYRYQI